MHAPRLMGLCLSKIPFLEQRIKDLFPFIFLQGAYLGDEGFLVKLWALSMGVVMVVVLASISVACANVFLCWLFGA